jgi:hypothetical protein
MALDGNKQQSHQRTALGHEQVHTRPGANQPSVTVAPVRIVIDPDSLPHAFGDGFAFDFGSPDLTSRYIGQVEQPAGIFEWISYKKNLETLYFCANIGLFVMAPLAFAAAIWQVFHARKARLASTYQVISKDWDRLETHKANIKRLLVGDDHERCGASVLAVIEGNLSPILPVTEADTPSISDSADTLLSYLEEVGHLCRNKYLRARDVSDMIGDGLATFLKILMPYIRYTREGGDGVTSQTYYANCLWLHKKLTKLRPRRFSLSD